jgi:hypothetical protein
MCKRLIYSIAFVLVIVLAGNTSMVMGQVLWDGGGDGRLWSDPKNWSTDALPTSSDAAYIDVKDANCFIDQTVNAVCATVSVSRTNKPCYLNMTGGALISGGHIRIAEPADSNGFFIMNGGTINTSNVGRLWVGMGRNSNGVFILNGGVITVSDKVEVGKNAGSNGFLYINGGTLNVSGYGSDDFEIGTYGTGTVYMTGGVINITDSIKLAQGSTTQSTGVGRIYLNGGTINASSLRDPATTYGTPQMDITTGKLVLTGDDTTMVNDYINRGWIIGYGGLGRVVATYSADANQTTVTAAMADPELAWNPNPANKSTVPWTPTGPTLTWKPGKYKVSHNVYFGTDFNDVNNANNTPGLWPEFKGRQDPCSYNQDALELGKTYYWRIDEVNDNAWAPAGSPWKGPIWSFTMANYAIVDNMESYGTTATPGPPPPAGSRIWYTWKDGEGWTEPSIVAGNGTGSLVDPNTGIVHGGIRSLKFYYDNDGTNILNSAGKKYYSEIRADTSYLTIGKNWAAAGVKGLVLYFYGDKNNDANTTEQIYVKLNGVKINYSGSMNDIREAKWHEWNIDLSKFGISLSNVTEIAIGFGNETNITTKGGSGIVYFDDIVLYPSRCVTSLLQPKGDLDNDCDVDYADLDIMAGNWLEKDSMRVGSDGLLKNFPTDNTQWVNDSTRGRCLQFDGVDDWVDLNDTDFSDFHNKTISLWINIREFPTTSDPYIFCFRDYDDIPYAYRIYIREHGANKVRMQFIGDTAEDYSKDFSEALPNTWHHVSFVLRDTGSNTCTGEFYGDGTLIHEFTDRPRHSGTARSVNLGSWNEGNAPYIAASLDDFRIYNTALSANEIKYLAGKAGGVEPTAGMMFYYKFDEVSGSTAKNSSTYMFDRPLLSVAELYKAEAEGSRVINFKDLSMLASTWLEQQLWP